MPPIRQASRSTERLDAWLVLLLAVGTGLRFSRLDRQSFWYDEAISVRLASASLLSLASGRARDLGNPPFYAMVLHVWGLLFGTSDAALRSLSAVAGVLAIPLLYGVAKRLVGPTPALVATGLLALSPAHVYFAQEARAYTLVTALCLLSLDMFLRGIENPRRAWVWVLHGVASFLAVYAHYFAVFVMLAQLAHLALYHRHERYLLRAWVASMSLAALAYATWLPSFLVQMHADGNLGRAAETWHLHMLSTPLVFSVGTTLLWKDSVTPLRIAFAALATVCFAVPAAYGTFRLRESRRDVGLLLLWLLLPIAVPLVVSTLLFPFYYVRYALLASPAFYVLIAVGLCALPRLPRAALVLGMVVPTALSFHTYFTTTVKHDWRDAARAVARDSRAGDVVVFDTDIGESPFARYVSSGPTRLRLMPPPAGQAPYYGASIALESPHDLSAPILASPRVWLVLSDLKIGSGTYYEDLFEHDWRRVSQALFSGIEVRLYERR